MIEIGIVVTNDVLQMCREKNDESFKLNLSFISRDGYQGKDVKIKNISFAVLLFQISKPSRFLPRLSS